MDKLNTNNKKNERITATQKDSGCLDFSKAGELGDADAYELIKKLCH